MLASTIALTGIAVVPARAASDEQIGKVLAGALTLFILGRAIEDISKTKKKAPVTRKATTSDYDAVKPKNPNARYNRNKRRVLPQECFFRIERGDRRVGVFGQKCLAEFTRRADRLPKDCAMVVPVRHGGKATVFSARCLRQHGYQMANAAKP